MSVKEAMLTDLGSRGLPMRRITHEIRDSLVRLAKVEKTHSAVPIQGSGSFAMEAALRTFLGPSDKVLVVVNGIYGERIADILIKSGRAHKILSSPVDCALDPADVAAEFDKDPTLTHLSFVLCETTTGMLNPYKDLVALAKSRNILTIIDAMSAFGGIEIDAERHPFDVMVTSGNKCIEAPPGVAFVLAPPALLDSSAGNSGSFSLDLHDQWLRFEIDGEWRSTPPTHVLQATGVALHALEAETIAVRNARYSQIAERVAQGLGALGFRTVLPPELRAPVCVALRAPDWAGATAPFFGRYVEYLERRNLHIYSKLHVPSQSFRVGCIGQIRPYWIDLFLEVTAAFIQQELAAHSVK
mmetsp:Transcript_18343/g.29477  ORF Transcript_18343/g.29477 Transcript_18343/m.29477 type:complete len:357 (+) Transcript_18343:5702-6772(+)